MYCFDVAWGGAFFNRRRVARRDDVFQCVLICRCVLRVVSCCGRMLIYVQCYLWLHVLFCFLMLSLHASCSGLTCGSVWRLFSGLVVRVVVQELKDRDLVVNSECGAGAHVLDCF